MKTALMAAAIGVAQAKSGPETMTENFLINKVMQAAPKPTPL